MLLRRRLPGLLALALALWSWLAPPVQAAPRLRVDFVAVGQGDATLVTSPVGKTVLIDGGPVQAGDELVAFLRGRGVGPLDLVLLTHRHEDHLGGLSAVLARRGARLFLDALPPEGGGHGTPAYRRLLDVIERRQIPVRQALAGRTIELGGSARLVLLTPPSPAIAGSRSDVNANSVVARLEYGRVRMLLAADVEAVTERWLLSSGVDLRATVLKVAHHGSRHSTTAAFLAAVSPAVAVIQVGRDNRYRHPSPETLARLAQANVRVFRTDRDGTVTLETDGERLYLPARAGPATPAPPPTASAPLSWQ